MYVAIDENNTRVHIENADKSKQYFCPICGEKLFIKAENSQAVKKHFAHKKDCLDTWKHDMSEWHYGWQRLFPENCREVVVEKDGVKHRADILINGFVIEFQHSPITAEEIEGRNNFYLSCGYQVIWVFDAQDKIKSYGTDSIDPFQTTLEWKRARREFNIPTPKGVAVFIEYSTKVSTNPPQIANIMLYLTKFDPKIIDAHDTKPTYITRWNFLKELGCMLENVDSITDIFKKHANQKQSIANNPQYITYRTSYGRKFRL